MFKLIKTPDQISLDDYESVLDQLLDKAEIEKISVIAEAKSLGVEMDRVQLSVLLSMMFWGQRKHKEAYAMAQAALHWRDRRNE